MKTIQKLVVLAAVLAMAGFVQAGALYWQVDTGAADASYRGEYAYAALYASDGSLLDGIGEDERVQNRLQGIIDFAKKIGAQTRVHGVADEELAKMVRTLGADQMTGELYGKPCAERSIKL